MSNIALRVENVSKQYRLGQVGTGTMTHDLNRFWHKIRGKEDPYLKIGETNDRTQKGTSDYVWALKDINFDIQQGDAVGIIGRNGAGKSTLLKLLSKVTQPTTGNIKVKGRIASLLEVGTGFHPEMTGRENIYLNGAILGMTRREIKRKFDEIVAFSGVERYIDTPVKRYSSGMYVRLAFAVAAHLESEILIVDEVLAVGDAEFQKKCLGKMGDVSQGEGRTVLFVSHNMAAVKSLCNKGIYMKHGEVLFSGTVDACISEYLGEANDSGEHVKILNIENEVIRLEKIEVSNISKVSTSRLVDTEIIELSLAFSLKSDQPQRYHITYHLHNEYGDAIFSFTTNYEIDLKTGANTLKCHIPEYFLQSGVFYISCLVVEDKGRPILIKKEMFSFRVHEGEREIGAYMGREPGFIRPRFNWINL